VNLVHFYKEFFLIFVVMPLDSLLFGSFAFGFYLAPPILSRSSFFSSPVVFSVWHRALGFHTLARHYSTIFALGFSASFFIRG
jgi:hypothetical protein